MSMKGKLFLGLILAIFLIAGAHADESDSTAEEAYYAALKTQSNKAIAGIYPTRITPLMFRGDFNWYYQNLNQVFNEGTFNYASARVSPGSVPGTAEMTPAGGFPTAYERVVTAMAFTLSTVDQVILNEAQENASAQAQAIITTFQGIFGEITDAEMQKAKDALGTYAISNKVDYVIAYVLGYEWSGRRQADKPPLRWVDMQAARNLRDLLPNMPPSGESVLSTVSQYLHMLAASVSLQDLLDLGGWTRQQLIANTENPSADNGGMKLVDPNTGGVLPKYQVGYTITPSITSIKNDLESSRSFSLSMAVSQASGSELEVHIDGGGGFTVGSLLKFTLTGGSEYDMTKVEGASMYCTVTMVYEGFTMVTIVPTAWQQNTNEGWFFGDPIAEAVRNFNENVTGFKFPTDPGYNMGPLAEGGDFGQLQNLLISKYPTIRIDFKQADFQRFKEHFREHLSGNLKLFGFIKLGGFDQGTYSSTYKEGSSNSEFSVIFQASEQVLTVPDLQKTAMVIGASFDFPGAPSEGESVVRDMLSER